MRWKSLLTCCSASICSTAQSPRARKAFSRACAARTCPAPDVADSNNTRGFVFICGEFLRRKSASGCLALAGADFFQNAPRDFLQISEARHFRRNAHAAVPGGLDPHSLSLAADTYVTRLRDLLRKGDHEFNFAANFEIGVREEVQPAVTDVSRVRVQLASFCRLR